MKRIVLVFFVLFLLLKINAQNQIKGVVTDSDKQPLPGVKLFFRKGDIQEALNSVFRDEQFYK